MDFSNNPATIMKDILKSNGATDEEVAWLDYWEEYCDEEVEVNNHYETEKEVM